MKIAIISPWAISETSVGGTERFAIDLATQLHKLGNEVEVFVLSGGSTCIKGVKYTSLDILGGGKVANEYDLQAFAAHSKDASFYRKWASYLESAVDISTFDLVQLNSLLFIDAWPGKPRLFTIHTNPFEYRLDWGQQRLDCIAQKIRTTLPDSTRLIAPSEHYARHFSKLFHRDVTTIPHAIDTSRLDNVAQLRAIKKGTSADDVTILLPSRLELVQKRPQIVFHGIALLPEHLRKRITVIATGKDSQYQDNCRKLSKIAEKGGFRAKFTKFHSMNEAYALADIVALPSKSESFGYAALESLALGIPTILNNLPTFKEIGVGSSNAHFFNQTAQAFSEALVEVLQTSQSSPTDAVWMHRYNITQWTERYLAVGRSLLL